MPTTTSSASGIQTPLTHTPPRVVREFVVCDDPQSPEVHCSSIQAAGGVVYATWFGGSKEGADDVRIWFAKRSQGGEWTGARVIAGEAGVVHWNPVCFVPDHAKPDEVIVFYKTGTPIPAWRSYVIASSDGGESWTPPRELVAGDTSGGRGPVKNPVLVLSNGDWLAGASTEVTTSEGGRWDAFVDIAPRPPPDSSWKQGRRWERSAHISLPPSFTGEGVIQPAVWESTPGRVHMHLRSSNGWIQRSDSHDYGRTWGEAYDSRLPSNNSGQCLVRMRDGRLVAAYNHVSTNWGPRTPLVLSISGDNGSTWRLWTVVEDLGAPEGFERVVALETGIVSDGRGEFSYPTVTRTEDDDETGVWVSYTWQRRGIVVCRVTDV